MYLNLLFKSIKADVGGASGDRVKALVRRFVQVLVAGGSGASEFVAGGLWLLGEVFLLSSLSRIHTNNNPFHSFSTPLLG